MRILFASFFLFIFSFSFAQITVESERDSEGNVQIYATNSDLIPYTIQFEFSNLQNLSATGGNYAIGVANPGKSKVATLKRGSANQSTNFSFKYSYLKGNIYAKSKSEPVYLIPVKEGTKVLGGNMTHIENRIRSEANNETYVGVSFRFDEEVEIVAPRKGTIVGLKMDLIEGKENLAFSREENYIEIYHEDGTWTKLMVLKGGSERVKLGQEVFPGDVLAVSGGENYENGRHIRMAVTKISKDNLGKLKYEIEPVKFWIQGKEATVESPDSFEVEHPKSLVTAEMSKRELKAYEGR
ncbi:peptidoglycan DD-metalloendopeptidase family protein [Algoriphagus algorifonticola]|uniref:peptidoglycan DD-metalloendopeptidase family protein n=1 Tax=Algoriphagus algorifonticola TaxID=2593007 RepID=UPI0011A6EAD6|nr:peptidoglycan DD-metalloendopeptidase family protein [Algoriphagus algorifonticola]